MLQNTPSECKSKKQLQSQPCTWTLGRLGVRGQPSITDCELQQTLTMKLWSSRLGTSLTLELVEGRAGGGSRVPLGVYALRSRRALPFCSVVRGWALQTPFPESLASWLGWERKQWQENGEQEEEGGAFFLVLALVRCLLPQCPLFATSLPVLTYLCCNS